MSDGDRQRVQKLLASAGLGSRRACEELIAAGRVTVDGEVVRLGAKADPRSQVIAVDADRVHTNPTLTYLLLNKPRNVVTTADDPQGRQTVMDFVPAEPRVFPVGRLDQDTEGLLLLTNDGELAHRLTHPRYEIRRTYLAQVRGRVPGRALKALRTGVQLDDGPARAVSARALGTDGDRSLVEVVLTEGRNREVRRLCGAAGLTVERLARVQMGPVELGNIKPGKVRPLNSREVADLYRAVGLGAQRDSA